MTPESTTAYWTWHLSSSLSLSSFITKVMVKSDFFQGPEPLGDLESRKQDFYYVLFDFALFSQHLALESRTAIPFQCIYQWLQK